MITLPQMERLIDGNQFTQLLTRIVEGGRCPLEGSRDLVRVCGGRGLPPAAIGLALQRMTELTYAPSPPARTLAGRLIGLQRADGLWGEGPAAIAPSAIALRGLLDFEQQRRESRRGAVPGLDSCIDRGARAIASIQRADGSIGRDPADGPVVLWQLGQSHIWLPIRFFDLRRAVERGEEPDASTTMPLRRLACAAVAA